MKNVVPISIASLIFIGVSTHADARTMAAAIGRPVTASQASCFAGVWNGYVTNKCSSRIDCEIDLVMDSSSIQPGSVKGCFNSKNVSTANMNGYYDVWIAAYQPETGYYTSPGKLRSQVGGNTSCGSLHVNGLTVPSRASVYATCQMPQNLQWFNVVYNP